MGKESQFYGTSALIFLVSNPAIALVLIIVAIVAGGMVMADFIAQLMNPIVWILSLVGSMLIFLTKKVKYTLLIATFLGLLWFSFTLPVCDIPIICFIIDIFTFVPKLFHLGIIIATILLQMTVLGLIAMALKPKRR